MREDDTFTRFRSSRKYLSTNGRRSESGRHTVEEIALERLANGKPKKIDDQLDEFVGAFRSDVPDWADNHNKCLGAHLMREMRGEQKNKTLEALTTDHHFEQTGFCSTFEIKTQN